MGPLDGGYLGVAVRLFLDGLQHGLKADQLGADLAQRAQGPHVGVVVFVDPETGETHGAGDNRQVIRRVLLVDILDQRGGVLAGGHDQSAARLGQFVDGLEAVPGPGLDSLAHGVIDVDGDIHGGGLINGHALLKFQRRIGYNGELLRRDAVPFGRVSVAAEGRANLAVFAGGENDVSDDVPGQSLLEYAPVHHLHS